MFSYKFSNLLGASYQGGNLEFTQDGNSLISSCGSNRTQVVDLLHNRSLTLDPENRKTISKVALSRDNKLLLQVDQEGHALLVNFLKGTVLHRIRFKEKVRDCKWSPDGKWLAVSSGRHLQLWKAPSLETSWNFCLWRTMGGHRDDIGCVTWSECSGYLLTGGDDMQVRLYSVEDHEDSAGAAEEGEAGAKKPAGIVGAKKRGREGQEKTASGSALSDKKGSFGGFVPQIFAGQRQPIRGCYFSKDKRNVFCISKDGVCSTWHFELDETAENAENAQEQEEDVWETGAQVTDVLRRKGTWSCVAKAFMHIPGGHKVTQTSFNVKTNVLAVGTTGGIFMLFELLPKLSVLHTLSLGGACGGLGASAAATANNSLSVAGAGAAGAAAPIDAIAVNPTGEWVAVGSKQAGQLLVWEWQSETYILKQQGHSSGTRCCAFSPSGT